MDVEVTPFLQKINFVLFRTQKIGDDWVTDLYFLRKLLPLAKDDAFMRAVYRVKQVRSSVAGLIMYLAA